MLEREADARHEESSVSTREERINGAHTQGEARVTEKEGFPPGREKAPGAHTQD